MFLLLNFLAQHDGATTLHMQNLRCEVYKAIRFQQIYFFLLVLISRCDHKLMQIYRRVVKIYRFIWQESQSWQWFAGLPFLCLSVLLR